MPKKPNIRLLELRAKALKLSGWPFRIFGVPCIEPVKRKHGNGEQWMVHRFPIKGGITWHDAMLIEAATPNPWYRKVSAA